MTLLNVAGWSQQDFALRWKTLLPCLITNIDEDKESMTDALRIIYTSIVPVMPVEDLEECVFSDVCEKTKNHFVAILDSLVQILGVHREAEDFESGSVSSELNTLLQVLTAVTASVAECVEYVSRFESGVSLESIRSLPSCVLHLMATSFAHCRDSRQMYGQLFRRVSDCLSGLFRATRQLQSNFSALLEGLKIMSVSEEEVDELCSVIQQLCEVCETVSSVDVKVTVALWKTISRLSSQHRDILIHQLNIQSLLTQLCQNMSFSCDGFSHTDPNALLPSDGGGQGKVVKIIGFQMRILVTLITQYRDQLDDVNISPIYQLIIQIKGFLPPSLAAWKFAPEVCEELVRHVGIGLEPLIACLVDHPGFLAINLNRGPGALLNDVCGSGISRLMTLLTIAQLLPIQSEEVQNLWLEPPNNPEGKSKHSLVDAIFCTISDCYVELCVPVSLPNVIKNGTPQVQLSLYEYVVTRLCTFVVTFPAEHFTILENCLLRNVLSRRQHCAMVAIDVWCFLARCGSAELCRDHCSFLASLFHESRRTPSAEHCHLVLLIRRLFRLMAPEHQSELVSKFAGSEVFSILPFDVTTISNGQTMVDAIIKDFIKSVEHWASDAVKSVAGAKSLVFQLSTLTNVSVVADSSFSMSQQYSLASHCVTLLSVLPSADKTDTYRQLFCSIVSAALFFLSRLVVCLRNRSIFVLLQFCDCVLPSCEDVIKLSILEVLGELAAKTFDPDPDQNQIFRIIPNLFSTLLDDSDNVLLHQVALETFKNFAKKTKHETLVTESLGGNEKIRLDFTKYMQQQTASSHKQEVDLEFLRVQNAAVGTWCCLSNEETWVQDNNSLTIIDRDDPKAKIDNREEPPAPKRSKIAEEVYDTNGAEMEEPLRAALDRLDGCVVAIEDIVRLHAVPDWAIRRLAETKKCLDSLL